MTEVLATQSLSPTATPCSSARMAFIVTAAQRWESRLRAGGQDSLRLARSSMGASLRISRKPRNILSIGNTRSTSLPTWLICTAIWQKTVYRALLVLVHGKSDLRVTQAFHRGSGLVRGVGAWLNADMSQTHRASGLEKRLSALPAVKYLDRDKDAKPIRRVDSERPSPHFSLRLWTAGFWRGRGRVAGQRASGSHTREF